MWKSLMFWTIAYPDFVNYYLSFRVAYIKANLQFYILYLRKCSNHKVNIMWMIYLFYDPAIWKRISSASL